MNIETLIQGNTDALIGLTEAIIKLTAALDKKEPASNSQHIEIPFMAETMGALNSLSISKPVENVQKVIESPDLDYPTVKTLINSLALTHRDEIKILNAKYHLAVFADILVDKNDVSKGVKDRVLLQQYYTDLTKIEV